MTFNVVRMVPLIKLVRL